MRSIVRSRSRSENDSPTHTIGVMPFSSSAWTFVFTSSSVSPLFARRSLWPTMQYFAPRSAIMSTLISPVCAPLSNSETFCAPTPMRRAFSRASAARCVAGTQRTTLHPFMPAGSFVFSSSTNGFTPEGSWFIFQFPAMMTFLYFLFIAVFSLR